GRRIGGRRNQVYESCTGGCCCGRVRQGLIDDRSKFGQHLQRLPGGILGMKHHLPGVTDHAKALGRLLMRKVSATAVQHAYSAPLKFPQAVMNGVQVFVHEPEEDPPDQEIEAGKSNQSNGEEIVWTSIALDLPPFFENMRAKKLREPAASGGGFDDLLQRGKPIRNAEVHRADNGFQSLGDVSQIALAVVQVGRSHMREILDQQEIHLVTLGRAVLPLSQVTNQKESQPGLVRQSGHLQEMAQLMNLDLSIQRLEPIACRMNTFFGRCVKIGVEIGARWCFENKLAGQREV